MSGQILYTTVDSVKVRLTNKVQFQSDPAQLVDGEMPNELLLQLIQDAETDVENALRARYAIPFQHTSGKTFAELPDHTRRAIRKLVDSRAVMLILDNGFGAGTHIDSSKYYDKTEANYTQGLREALGQDLEGQEFDQKRFRRAPPLDCLRLAPSNSKADDGYRGMVINTDQSEEDAVTYAERQLNNPAQGFLGRRVIRGG